MPHVLEGIITVGCDEKVQQVGRAHITAPSPSWENFVPGDMIQIRSASGEYIYDAVLTKVCQAKKASIAPTPPKASRKEKAPRSQLQHIQEPIETNDTLVQQQKNPHDVLKETGVLEAYQALLTRLVREEVPEEMSLFEFAARHIEEWCNVENTQVTIS